MDESMRRFVAPRGRSLRDKGLLVLAVPLAFEIGFVLVVMAMESSAAREHEAEMRAQATITSAYHVLQLVVDTETAIRGYIIAGQPRFAEPYKRAIREVPLEIERLQALVAKGPHDVALLKARARTVLAYQTMQHERIVRGHRAEAATIVEAGTGKQLMDSFRASVQEFLARYRVIHEQTGRSSVRARRNLRNVVVGGLLMNVIVAATMAEFFARSITRRLAVVVENTFLIERREPLRGAVQGSDEIAQLDARFHSMANALEKSRRELEAFTYSVSHDLRAPLRAVNGYARMIEEDFAAKLDAEGRRYLATIRSEARRMGQLIDDLLAFSRLGRQPLQLAPVDVAAIAREALADIPEASDARVTVRIDAPPALADRAMLRQVFVNLLSNAIKFSGNQPEILVEVGGSVGERHNVYWVRDHGVGFDMRFADKLFGVFQRLHAAHEFEGTGVGLAIVQRVIERHGGTIRAEAEEGRGACFTFTLASTEKES
jgi:signal transduction histidine kinase